MNVARAIRSGVRWYLLVCALVLNLMILAAGIYALDKGPNWVSQQLVKASERIYSRSHAASSIFVYVANIVQARPSPGEFDPITDIAELEPEPREAFVESGARRLLSVGPRAGYSTIASAAKAARDGDIVEIAAGVYQNDTTVWSANNITIRGKDGFAVIDASNTRLVQEKAIWVIQGDNYRVENIGFKNAKSRDLNGAGIRSEGANLHIVKCFFYDNETALLSSQNPRSTIIFERSTLARNGHANGQAHQVYIGAIEAAIFRFNYLHHARTGSSLKSRAKSTIVEYNRILDGVTGTGNYSLDFSDGGRAIVFGNTIQQGPYTNNNAIIAFATESNRRDNDKLLIAHNTIVNSKSRGTFVRNRASNPALLYNNVFVGAGNVIDGDGILVGNTHNGHEFWRFFGGAQLGGIEPSYANTRARDPGVVSLKDFNFHPSTKSPAVDSGVALESIGDYSLVPEFEYAHALKQVPRYKDERIDAGANEHRPAQ